MEEKSGLAKKSCVITAPAKDSVTVYNDWRIKISAMINHRSYRHDSGCKY